MSNLTHPIQGVRFVWLLTMAASLSLLMPCAAQATERASAADNQKQSAKRPTHKGPPLRSFAGHPALKAFADEVAARHGWPVQPVLDTLSQARVVPAVQRLIMPPPAGTAKNWAAYRARFVEPARIAAGVRFWASHEAALAQAEAQHGVPAEIIVSIIGVETYYGRIMGSFRLIDALATLAFEFPSGRSDRSPFFRQQLEELLVWTHQTGQDPTALRGSYAGAWGLPQFMPGSVNRYAVDADGDGRIDLGGNGVDAIGSVANYLAQHGWIRGMATHHAVAAPVDTSQRARLLQPDILPTFTAQQMLDAGAELSPSGRAHTGPLALVELQNGDAAPSYVAGTQNFYTITRYNWSSYYALAVIDLAEALAQARSRAPVAR